LRLNYIHRACGKAGPIRCRRRRARGTTLRRLRHFAEEFGRVSHAGNITARYRPHVIPPRDRRTRSTRPGSAGPFAAPLGYGTPEGLCGRRSPRLLRVAFCRHPLWLQGKDDQYEQNVATSY